MNDRSPFSAISLLRLVRRRPAPVFPPSHAQRSGESASQAPMRRDSAFSRALMKLGGVIFSLWLLPLTGFSEPAESKMTWDNAGVYSTRRGAPEKALIESLAPKAKVTESKDGDKTVFMCEWPDVSVKINVDPHWDLAHQTSEMKRWINTWAASQKTAPSVVALFKRLDESVDCYGCVITPHYDAEGKAASLILGLAAKCHGFVFSHQTFYEADGDRIIGMEGDPDRLRDSK